MFDQSYDIPIIERDWWDHHNHRIHPEEAMAQKPITLERLEEAFKNKSFIGKDKKWPVCESCSTHKDIMVVWFTKDDLQRQGFVCRPCFEKFKEE